METGKLWGYTGKILRVDLSRGLVREEPLEKEVIDQYFGGAGFGAEYLNREVPPGVAWDDPENRIILASGPLGGTVVSGTGTFTVVTKGPMTNLAVSTQANGFWGAFLRFAGYDAVVVQGKSPRWVYLHISEGKAELRDAAPILGKDTWDMEEAIQKDLGTSQKLSVFGVGPAGENLVRFAIIGGDRGHIASKNGCGCVMGSKRLKAIAIPFSRKSLPVYDEKLLSEKAAALVNYAKEARGGHFYKWGTGGGFSSHAKAGSLPVRNYSTNLYPEHEQVNAQYLRTHFPHRGKPCWACRLAHTKYMKVTEGPYTGFEGEEPEYEGIAAWGPVIGNTDAGATVVLSNLTDRLGLDVNEASWTIGWVMECYEKGIFTQKDLDGLDMRWGNVEGVRSLLEKISRREGIGNLLAEGVKRACEKVGGEAAKMGIFVVKGSTPRGHDHRAIWPEMLDTCVSATSTIQANSRLTQPQFFGLPNVGNPFSHWEVAAINAKLEGWFVFVDALGICRFITIEPHLTLDCVNAVTGRGLAMADVLTIGKRIVNQLRVFNYRHGLDTAEEVPSPRYGSTPVDGPVKDVASAPHFQWMKSFYFELMGWDPKTGKPRPETLKSLGLEKLIGTF